MWRFPTKQDAATHPFQRLYLCAGILMVLLFGGSAALVMQVREHDLLREENDLRKLSLTLAEEADRSFQTVDLVLTSLVDRLTAAGVVDDASFDATLAGYDIHRLLRDKIDGIPQIDAVTLIDATGNLVNFSRYWPIPKVNVADRAYFQALKTDTSRKTYIVGPIENRGTGAWTIFVARRFNGPKGEFLGVIFGAVELRYFEDFYRAIALGEGSAIIMLREDGTTLVRYPPNDTVGKSFGGQQILAGGRSGTVRAPAAVDGKMTLKAARLLANYPIIMLTTKTEEAALEAWSEMARARALGTLGLAGLIVFVTFGLARHWKQQDVLATAQAELRRQADRTATFEAMRVAKEAAESANLAKSEFLTTMSHELRTPLNAILGFSDMMVGEVIGPLGNPRYISYAKDIHDSGSHLLALINEILDLSKSVAGKLELAEGQVDARTVVESVCRLVQPRVTDAGLTLATKLPGEPVVLRCDERKLMQMLLNLLSNAYKFTLPGGHVECRLTVDAAGIHFSVGDDGIGIPATELDRVLQPFAQVDSSLSRRHDGTGLGLTLVKAMAELHGGSLRLASTVGVGTTATVTLPLDRLVREDAARPQLLQAQTGR
ncbi:MAG: Hpt sensor hybrid histidine kinase [Rhodospirillales bacterium]|nr:Hpt sensor hybrid histidine kinase [Rhodospirillales bacterium]